MLPVLIGLMTFFLPAATVGSSPTIFVGWVVGLVCGVTGLLEFFASFICARLWSFESIESIIFSFFYLLGVSRLLLFVDIFVVILTFVTVGDCLY